MLPIVLSGEDTWAGDALGIAWSHSARWSSALAVLRSVRCCDRGAGLAPLLRGMSRKEH